MKRRHFYSHFSVEGRNNIEDSTVHTAAATAADHIPATANQILSNENMHTQYAVRSDSAAHAARVACVGVRGTRLAAPLPSFLLAPPCSSLLPPPSWTAGSRNQCVHPPESAHIRNPISSTKIQSVHTSESAHFSDTRTRTEI
jgi:hypothetical protein